MRGVTNWGVLVPVLGVLAIAAGICNGATPTQDSRVPIWPTKEWQISTPEEEGMDSKELVKLVDFGAQHILALSGAAPGERRAIGHRLELHFDCNS